MGVGEVSISPGEIAAILSGQLGLAMGPATDARQESVLLAIRLPRVLATVLVGAAWAVAGVAMQGLYRTRLADPAIVGIGAGAALGAAAGTVIAVSLGLALVLAGTVLVSLCAFAVALVVAALLYRVAAASGRPVVATMLLAGVVLSAFLAASTALMLAASRAPELGTVGFWTLGSFAGIGGRDVVAAAVVVVAAGVVLWRLAPRLDALALGEREAGHLGIDVRRLRWTVSVAFAALTAVAVAVAGVIAFVALVVPGLIRPWLGPDHRTVLIGSALLGGIFLVLADLSARTLFSPAELPVGVITTLLGAPLFLWLLLRERDVLAR